MADLSFTATGVTGSGVRLEYGTAGTTLTAGQPVYFDSVTNTYKLAQCDGAVTEAGVYGFTLDAASAGQPILIQRGGDLYYAAELTQGIVYVLSATAGKICPSADLVSGNYVTVIGVARTSSILQLGILVSGATKA